MNKRHAKEHVSAGQRAGRADRLFMILPALPPAPTISIDPAIHPVLTVGIGGVIGSLARYGVGELLDRPTATSFPWNTLAVNLIGSFLIMLFFSYFDWLDERTSAWLAARHFCVVGVIGGFTTFSALSNDMAGLIRGDAWLTAALYLVVTMIGGPLIGVAGYIFGRRLQLRG